MIVDEEICRHEASHAAALILVAGWPPLIARADNPGKDIGGQVLIDWQSTDGLADDWLRSLAISVIVAGLDEAPIAQFTYPLNASEWPVRLGHDVETLKTICQWLELDAVSWCRLVFDAVQVTRQRDFRLLRRAIADRLRDQEFLVREELLELAGSIDDG